MDTMDDMDIVDEVRAGATQLQFKSGYYFLILLLSSIISFRACVFFADFHFDGNSGFITTCAIADKAFK